MTVHIGELTSRVEAEGAPASVPTTTAAQDAWDSLRRARNARARVIEIESRTRAEGHDD